MTDHTTYSSTLLIERTPVEAMEAFKVRAEQLKEVNHQVAEWLTSYGRLRLKYADDLKKLAHRGATVLSDAANPRLHSAELDAMGLCTPMWSSVLRIANDEARYFDSTTRMMGRDMIAPLKLYARRNDTQLVEMDDLATLSQQIARGGSASSASRQQWSERAPDFFEQFERYDYNRLVLLKDVFLKFQTEMADVFAQFKKDNEAGMEHVLSFSPQDEVDRFADAVKSKPLPIVLLKEETTTTQPVPSISAPPPLRARKVASPSSNKRMSLLPGRHHHDDDNNTFTNTATPRVASTASKKDKRHSVRSRIGTIFGRRHKKNDASSLHSSVILESDESSSATPVVTRNERHKENTPIKETEEKVADKAADKAEEKLPAVPVKPVSPSPVPVTAPVTAPAPAPVSPASTYYPPMRPTKRSGSVNSGSSSIKEVASQQPSQPAPPPSRHVTSEPSELTVPTPRVARGSAPLPPATRRLSSLELQPALTGMSTQDTGMAGNTTGGGGLMGGQIVHPSMTAPGLNASVVELCNASYKGGELVRSNAIGEVAFSYILEESAKKIPAKIDLAVASKSGKPLPNFVVNTMFLQQDAQQPGSYVINDPSQIKLRTVGGLKYMLNDPTPPIVIQSVWQHKPDRSTVIVSVAPSKDIDKYLVANPDRGIAFSNVYVSVAIQGASASTASTKPMGSFNRQKNRVLWHFPGDIVFNAGRREERLIARFLTDGVARESDSGIQLRFVINNDDGASAIGGLSNDLEITARSEAGVDDPFGSKPSLAAEDWADVPTLKTIVAGGYSGHA